MNEAFQALALLFGFLALMFHGCFAGVYGDPDLEVKPPRDGGKRAPLRGGRQQHVPVEVENVHSA
jgi:hypothetical protein